MPKIKANGIQLYYELHDAELGNARDVLVLSNGVLMSTASWAFQSAGAIATLPAAPLRLPRHVAVGPSSRAVLDGTACRRPGRAAGRSGH